MKRKCKQRKPKKYPLPVQAQSIKSTILKPEEPQGKFVIYEWPIRVKFQIGG